MISKEKRRLRNQRYQTKKKHQKNLADKYRHFILNAETSCDVGSEGACQQQHPRSRAECYKNWLQLGISQSQRAVHLLNVHMAKGLGASITLDLTSPETSKIPEKRGENGQETAIEKASYDDFQKRFTCDRDGRTIYRPPDHGII